MQTSSSEPEATERKSKLLPTITAFICADCCRGAHRPSSATRPVPTAPDFCWPLPVHELLVPCTGRLQPEHILKAFELGADVVCVIGCEEDNCHTLEGSSRCVRRVDYVRDLLDQIGIGRDRLLRFKLPGSSQQDMSLAASEPCRTEPGARSYSEGADVHLQALRQTIRDSIANLKLSPIHNSQWSTATTYPVEDDAQSED